MIAPLTFSRPPSCGTGLSVSTEFVRTEEDKRSFSATLPLFETPYPLCFLLILFRPHPIPFFDFIIKKKEMFMAAY